MKPLLTVFMAVVLALVPFLSATYAQKSPPPIEGPLVREGEYAVQLARALTLTSSNDEVEAESVLTSTGIAPRNGWISDYPVTPDILAEIQASAVGAADSGRLTITGNDVMQVIEKINSESGLRFSASNGQNGYASERSPAPENYQDQAVIERYYYESGPPIITYYPPPWAYSYLYGWVPYPFWWGGYPFGGYFILYDFDGYCHHRHHHRNGNHYDRVSNHLRNDSGRAVRIDPGRRLSNTDGAQRARLAGPPRADSRQGAQAILNRTSIRPGTNTAAPAPSVNRSRPAPPPRQIQSTNPNTGAVRLGPRPPASTRSGSFTANPSRIAPSSGFTAPRSSGIRTTPRIAPPSPGGFRGSMPSGSRGSMPSGSHGGMTTGGARGSAPAGRR